MKKNEPEWTVKKTNEVLDQIFGKIQDKADAIEKVRRKSYYKPVAGRKKLSAGKKARAENKGSTEFEMELVHYLTWENTGFDNDCHVFRSPASKTPVDVWMIRSGYQKNTSLVHCYQCKTTKDTKPPRIDRKELEAFRKFTAKINAKAFWVDRWKKNKNLYIRRISEVDSQGNFILKVLDFSHTLNQNVQGRSGHIST